MGSQEYLLLLLLYVILLLLSCYFSCIETAVFYSNHIRIKNLARKGNQRAQIVKGFLDKPEEFLSTILAGVTIAEILLASLSSYLFIVLLGEKGVIISSVATTLIILLFGEMLPKSLATNMPEKISLFFAPLTLIVYKLLLPVVKVLSLFSALFLKLLGVRGKGRRVITEDDIHGMFVVAQEEGVLNKEKASLYKNIHGISDIICREIMVPKFQVVAMDSNAGMEQCVATVREHKYSRYPIYEGQPDNITGVVHAKDIMDFWGEETGFCLKKILRAPLFIPDILYVEEVFELLKKNRAHLGCVVDEYGSFEGIVTLEDVLEEIVGEIRDEHDFDEEIMLRVIDDSTFLASGNTSMRDINKALGLNLPEEENTLAGFIFWLVGRIPEREEEISHGNLTFKIKNIKGNRIKRILIRRADDDVPKAEQPG